MIPSALVVSSEVPPNEIDLKRALLSFGGAVLLHPEDRDLIPENALLLAQGDAALPFGMSTGPVRPLGKVHTYDVEFDQTLDTMQPAIEQGLLRVLDAPRPPPRGLTIGAVPLPDRRPDPRWTYQTYRSLAEHPAWVSRALRGLDLEVLRAQPDVLSPRSADEGQMAIFVDGVEAVRSSPLAAVLGEGMDSDDAVIASRLAHARIGAVVKAVGISQIEGLIPYADHPGVADILTDLGGQVMETVVAEDAVLHTYLARVHRIVIEEYVDDEALAAMSVRDLLRQRTSAWGRLRENRFELHRVVRRLAAECETDAEFDQQVRSHITKYQSLAAEMESEGRGLLRSTVTNAVGAVATGAAVHAAAASSLVTAITIIGQFATSTVDALRVRFDTVEKFHASAAFSVANPYGYVLRGD